MRQMVIDKIVELTTPDEIKRSFVSNRYQAGRDAEAWLQYYNGILEKYTDAQLLNLYVAAVANRGIQR